MKSFVKTIITALLVFSIAFSNIILAYSDIEVTSEVTTFWERYMKWGMDNAKQFGDTTLLFQKLAVLGLSDNVCSTSDDSLHHGNLTGKTNVVGGQTLYAATCNYCNKTFFVSENQVSTAYSDYVNTLPAQGYDSAGTLLWQPNWSDIIFPSTLSSIAGMNGSIVTISSSGFNFIDRTYPSSSPTAHFLLQLRRQDLKFVLQG